MIKPPTSVKGVGGDLTVIRLEDRMSDIYGL